MAPFIRYYKSGAHLFHEKDRSRELYIIQDGQVDVYRRIGNHDVVLARLGRGSVLGEMALIDGKPRSASARAATDGSAIIIDAESFLEKIKGVPPWYLSLVKTTSEKIRKAIDRLEKGATGHQTARGIILLNYLARRQGDGGPLSLDVAATQVRMVQLMGITHHRAVEVFEYLQRHGMMVSRGSTATIPQPGRLNDYCAFLRLALRKSYDRMPAISAPVRALISLAVERRAAILDPSSARTDIAGDDMRALMLEAKIAGDLKEAADQLRDQGLLRYRRADGADTDDPPLAGMTFTIDNAAWLKWHLYCQFSQMMPEP